MQSLFRKIRGILNKLTPDNFDKLSYELTQLPAINSKEALKGVILLVYDKALEESQYTYMYAQLCRRLNELVPNFEESGSLSTTFRKVLLHKCQEEFENRKAASALFDGGNRLSSEEERQRGVAKRKMLGNIRFVGELFKIGVLHEAIIHSCIKELLEKRRGASVAETAENVECLCHFMTTVGGRLDTHKAKGWMNKYFERIQSLTTNPDLPRRIHFMLLDLLELRAKKWQPRRSSSQQGPRPIHEIRQEVYQQDKTTPSTLPPFSQPGFRGPPYTPQQGPSGDEGFISAPPDSRHLFSPQEPVPMVFPAPPTLPVAVGVTKGVEPSKPVEKKPLRKLPKGKTDNTVSLRPSTGGLKPSSRRPSHGEGLAGEAGGSTALLGDGGVESGHGKVKVEQKLPRTRDDSSDEEDPRIKDTVLPHPPLPSGPIPSCAFVPGYHPAVMTPREPFYPRGPVYPVTKMPPRPLMPAPPHSIGHPHHPPPGPRFYGPPPPMRSPVPPYSGQRFRPPPQGVQPGHVHPPGWATHTSERPHPPPETKESILPHHLERNEPVKVKYMPAKPSKKGGALGKKAVKDENEKAVEPVITQFLKSRDTEVAVTAIKELSSVPSETLTTLLLIMTLDKSEDDRTRVSELMKQLYIEEHINSPHCLQAVKKILSTVEYESSLPQYKTYLAGFIARAIAHGVMEIGAITTLFNLGAHHPTLLVVLQALTALVGEEKVAEVMRGCGVKLTSLLPVEYRSHEAISELLESKKLIFLYPLRRIQVELTAKLRQPDSTAVAIYKWIKTNVDPAYYHTPEFVMVLTKCILEYVCSESTLAPSVNLSDHPSKAAVATEEQLMEKFKILIVKFVSDDPLLQISTLYATQTFSHQKGFPKGLLLRLFSHLYNMDVVEEDSFFKWKEDLSQEFPGKGKALFQVNHWLVLLAEAESSEDER